MPEGRDEVLSRAFAQNWTHSLADTSRDISPLSLADCCMRDCLNHSSASGVRLSNSKAYVPFNSDCASSEVQSCPRRWLRSPAPKGVSACWRKRFCVWGRSTASMLLPRTRGMRGMTDSSSASKAFWLGTSIRSRPYDCAGFRILRSWQNCLRISPGLG